MGLRTLLLALVASLIATAPARADSGRLHLHVDVGAGSPVAGPARPAAGEPTAAGGAAWLSVDYQWRRPFAVEGILGVGGFARPYPSSGQTGTRYTTVGFGLRLRAFDDPAGYADEEGGNWPSHLWISAHVGFHHLDDAQLGVDAAIGYELSVRRPFSLGFFVRTALAFGGDSSGPDLVLVGGLSFTYELVPAATTTDSDADGIPDTRELELGLDPRSADTDSDGIADGVEVTTGTDPLRVDTDGDGLSDRREDRNGDGILDVGETDPRQVDTDGGGIGDGDEAYDPDRDPRYAADDDRDGDHVPDHVDQCPSSREGERVDPAGCAVVSGSAGPGGDRR